MSKVLKSKKQSFHLDFNPKSLEQIYTDLVRLQEDNSDEERGLLEERIRQMTEFQIWGEKFDESFFEFFCEKNVMEIMLNILKKTQSREIMIQVIQSLSMYLTNIKKPMNINYIMSSNTINEYITHDFDFANDDVVDYYISFLKSFSLRIEALPMEMVYNTKYKDFPLLSHAVRFYNHPGSMVRTSVQNITLTMFKLENEKLRKYITNFPFANYFVNTCCYLKDLWIQTDKVLLDSSIESHTRLHTLLDDQYDILMYIEDIFQLGIESINKIVANSLMSYVIIPMLIAPLSSHGKGPISLNLSLYLLYLIFSNIKYAPLLELIFLYLFAPKITPSLTTILQYPPKAPVSYSFKWSMKTPWDQREDILNQKYLALLESTSGNQLVRSDSSDSTPGLNIQQTFDVNTEYSNLAMYSGVVTEVSNERLYELLKNTPLQLLQDMLSIFSAKGDLVDIISLSPNEVRATFFLFLTSRDDNMILLMCSIIDSALSVSSAESHISAKTLFICRVIYEKFLVSFSQMIPEASFDEVTDKDEARIYLVECLYKLLNVDPPFRIVTMRLITKLIIGLSEYKTSTVMMTQRNLASFNDGYRNSINKSLRALQDSMLGEMMIPIFNTLWQEINKQNFPKLKRNDYLYTLLPVPEEAFPGIDSTMRAPITEVEFAKREIIMFLMFRKIRYNLIKVSKLPANLTENLCQNHVKTNASNSWVEGNLYDIGRMLIVTMLFNSQDERRMHQCKLKDQKSKQVCYVAEDEENFLIISPDPNKMYSAKIIMNEKLKDIELIIDKSTPKKMVVLYVGKKKPYEKIITFPDKTMCLQAKNGVDSNRMYFKHTQMTMLLKIFEHAKSDIYEIPVQESLI